jgi:drug/metabolite transporter (DMT)-like permease
MYVAAAGSSSGLPVLVTLTVLGAAVVHASWNAIAHRIKDKMVGFALLSTGSVVCAIPLAASSPLPDVRSWPFLLASAALHVGYNVLLMQSYRFGDFNQVYPLARGTSPLVVTVLAAVFVGEYLALPQILGIILITGGMCSLVFIGRRPGSADRPAIAAAIGTGLVIATYTAIDGVGVRLSDSPVGYTAWLVLLHSPVIPVVSMAKRGRELFVQIRPVLALGLIGGGLTLLAYGLVLWAQTRGALAPIAALRETSIIFGAIIGTMIFHERFGRVRILAAIFVSAGIVVMNIGL